MNTHPLDSVKFREWYKEQDEEWMAYGIYDSRWAELFDQFLEEQGADLCANNISPCITRTDSEDNCCEHYPYDERKRPNA
jgi:hypothetical protein